MRLAIFLPNWIGDAAMATPTLRALRRRWGGAAELIGLARPPIADVLAGTPWLDDIWTCDKRRWTGAGSRWELTGRLRRWRPDAAVLLTNSLATALMAWGSGAPRRYGYRRSARGWLLTDLLEPPRSAGKFAPISAVDYYLELAYALGCGPESRRLELATLPEDERRADAVWSEFDHGAGGQVVALCPSGAAGPAKHWPVEHFTELARRLAGRGDTAVLVVCGPAEREAARRIVAGAASSRVVGLADHSPSIGLSKACLRRAAVVVSTDSGPRHLAAAFDRPTVSLFGPTDPLWAVNYNPRDHQLQHRLPCQPCGRSVCPLVHHRCLRELPVERVLAAVEARLNDAERRAA